MYGEEWDWERIEITLLIWTMYSMGQDTAYHPARLLFYDFNIIFEIYAPRAGFCPRGLAL